MLGYTRFKGCLLRITFNGLVKAGLLDYAELNGELQDITEERVTELFTLFCVYGDLKNPQEKVEAIFSCFLESITTQEDINQLKAYTKQSEEGETEAEEIPLHFFSFLVQNGIDVNHAMDLNEKELYVLIFSEIKKNQDKMILDKAVIISSHLNLQGKKSELPFEQRHIKTVAKEKAQEAIELAPTGANPKMFERWN